MFSALIRWLAFSKPVEPIRPVPTPDGFNGFAQTHPFAWPEGDSDAGFLGNDGRLMATLHNLGRLGTEVSAFLVMPVLGFPELPEGSRLLSHEDTPVSLTVTPVDIPADLRCLPEDKTPIEGRVALVFEWLGWYWTRGLPHWSAFDEVRHHLLTGFFCRHRTHGLPDFARIRVSAALPRERLERVAAQTRLDAPTEAWLRGFVDHLHHTPQQAVTFPGTPPGRARPRKSL